MLNNIDEARKYLLQILHYLSAGFSYPSLPLTWYSSISSERKFLDQRVKIHDAIFWASMDTVHTVRGTYYVILEHASYGRSTTLVKTLRQEHTSRLLFKCITNVPLRTLMCGVSLFLRYTRRPYFPRMIYVYSRYACSRHAFLKATRDVPGKLN